MTQPPASMVDRVVVILRAFEGARGHLSLGQVVALTKFPRSSAHRILQQLVAARLLGREGDNYHLGLGIFELGSLVSHRNAIVAAAKPIMHELSASGFNVVHLAMLDHNDVVYLEKVGGRLSGSLPSRIGGRLPAHCTGVGKAILAFSPPNVVEAILERKLDSRTSATIAEPEALRDELQRIKQAGYASDRGEAVPSVGCIAAPVFEFGTVTAAISVCGPVNEIDASRLRRSVQLAATEVSRRITNGTRHITALSA